MADLLVDGDVFIDHLRGARALEIVADRGHYSTITRAELYAGPAAQEANVRELLAPFSEIPVDRDVSEAAGRIRRVHGIGLADALIAATAIASGLELLTRNVRDFSQVDGLRVREP